MAATILLDASCLSDEASATRGFGRYVRALLESVPSEGRVALIALASHDADLPAGVRRIELQRRAPARGALYEHALRLDRDARRSGADVLHQPTAEPALRSRLPYVQTLHDIIPMLFDEPGFSYERRRWRFRAIGMRRADLVIAITRWSGDLGVKHLGIDPDRVRVVLHGVNPLFSPPTQRGQEDAPYLIYVGEYGPHKGFEEACAAARALAEAGYPHQLRLVGNVSSYARPRVDSLLSRTPNAVHLGRLSDEALNAQYGGASALVFSSRCEGFGRPPIEAMATGTPVVAFANSSIPEVVGDAGALVPDGDVPALVRELRSLIDSHARWESLAGAGLRRASEIFSWDRCARETVDVYLEAASVR